MHRPVTVLSVALSSLLTLTLQKGLPQVDLGYEVHEIFSYNETTDLYKFRNIRYAQPPVGELRFAAPVSPVGRSTQVENGSVTRTCPQATETWAYISQLFQANLTAGNALSFNYSAGEAEVQLYLASLAGSPPDPSEMEDCLFLDVVVPKAVFDNTQNQKGQNWTEHQERAPVIVWFYGGGYTIGTKDSVDPSGLIRSSQVSGGQGIIFVAVNYRLGAFGWLSGPTLQAAGGASNAGLYDQRLATEWVAEYIHLFGGDVDRITIMGGSAGGGSVEHQITAYGGRRPAPFQKAVVQSPAFLPIASQDYQEGITRQFLSLLNVSSIEEARRLDSATLIATNALQVSMAEYGTTVYGPVVDGVFVPELPSTLLATGQHARNIQLLIGHQANEAPGFTPPYIRSTADLRQYIQQTYIGVNSSTLDYLVDVLYPEVYDGSYPYTNGLERAFLVIADSGFTCNTNALNKAFGNQSYAWEFQIPPALHGQDGPYTFYNGEAGVIAAIAEIQQGYITNFVATGNPNGADLPPFPMQGANASMNAWNITGVKTERDDTANQRCAWWQQGLFA